MSDIGGLLSLIYELEVKIIKIKRLIRILKNKLNILDRSLPSAEEITTTYQELLDGSGDESDGTMITYFEEKTEENEEEFDETVEKMKQARDEVEERISELEELLAQTEAELEAAKAALEAAMKAAVTF